MTIFNIALNAGIDGTHKVGELFICPLDFRKVFGDGNQDSGDGKTTREYTFTSSDGDIFTVYDWKRPFGYWDGPFPAWFSVGGRTDPSAFIRWVAKCVAEGGAK